MPEGRVEVRWHVEPSDTGRCLMLTWRELGGPAVSPPSRKGFGTRLIDSMGRGFGGRSQLIYDPSGVSWQASADTERLKTT